MLIGAAMARPFDGPARDPADRKAALIAPSGRNDKDQEVIDVRNGST